MATQAIISCAVAVPAGGKKESLSSEFLGTQSSKALLRSHEVGVAVKPVAGVVGVRAAISRKKKEETVERARQQLEGAYLVAGIKYAGLSVKAFQQLRKSLPEDTTLMVAKNKLVGRLLFSFSSSFRFCLVLWLTLPRWSSRSCFFDSRHSWGSSVFCPLSRVWNCQIVGGSYCIAFTLSKIRVESGNWNWKRHPLHDSWVYQSCAIVDWQRLSILSFRLCYMPWLVVPVVTLPRWSSRSCIFIPGIFLRIMFRYLFLRVWTCQIESGHTLLHFLYRRGTEVRWRAGFENGGDVHCIRVHRAHLGVCQSCAVAEWVEDFLFSKVLKWASLML